MSTPDRHALLVTAVALAAALIGSLGVAIPPPALAAGLALAVAVVGLPHGGLDHRAGRSVCGPLVGPWWPLLFLTSYVAVGGFVLAGWAVAPLATAGLFFALSAGHFAETERGPGWRAALFGGMVIWLTLLARPGESLTLLAWVAPAEVDWAGAGAAARPAFAALAGLAAACWLAESVRAAAGRDAAGLADAARLAAFALMFALAPVLVSFAVAFCGWHSLRELDRMAGRGGGLRRVLLAAAPSSLAAALLAAGGVWAFGSEPLAAPAVVQGVFLGLSAVAVPHILLHAVAARLGSHSRTEGVAGAV